MTERLDTEIFADDDEQTYRLTLADPGKPLEMRLQTLSGGIEVHAWDEETVEVTVTPDGHHEGEAIGRVTWDGAQLAVRPVTKRSIRRHGDYEVSVRVPRRLLGSGPGVAARIESASGEIGIYELTGDIRATTASGDVDLSRVAGRVEAQTASGGLSISGVRGRLRANAASGDISVHDAILSRARINGVSGDIDGSIVLAGEGPFEIAAVSASVDVEVGILSDGSAPARWDLQVKTLSGSVDIEGDAERRERRRWSLGTGSGDGGELRVNTVSGDISLRARPASVDGDLSDVTVPPRPDGDRDEKVDGVRGDDFAGADVGDIHVDLRGIADEVQSGIARAIGRIGRHVAPPAPPVPPAPPAPPAGTAAYTSPAPKGDEVAASGEPVVRITTPATAALDEQRARLDAERERLAVLRQLEDGEITVDEAMERLGGA